jgi:hypothetical protein
MYKYTFNIVLEFLTLEDQQVVPQRR